MNRRGQLIFLGIMMAVTIFIVAVVLIEPIKSMITIARDSDHLDCESESLTTGEEMTCIITDSFLPIFIGFLVAIAIAYLGLKEYRPGPPAI